MGVETKSKEGGTNWQTECHCCCCSYEPQSVLELHQATFWWRFAHLIHSARPLAHHHPATDTHSHRTMATVDQLSLLFETSIMDTLLEWNSNPEPLSQHTSAGQIGIESAVFSKLVVLVSTLAVGSQARMAENMTGVVDGEESGTLWGFLESEFGSQLAVVPKWSPQPHIWSVSAGPVGPDPGLCDVEGTWDWLQYVRACD